MKQVEYTLVADEPFEVPFSSGYQTYSGLLAVLDDVAPDLAETLHDRPATTLTNSGVQGTFGEDDADRPYHHTVLPRSQARYRLTLGVTDPAETELFDAIVRAFVIEGKPLPLAHGAFEVKGLETDETDHQTILDTASELAADESVSGVELTFDRPTCRQRTGEVYDAHPDRTALFPHLADRWNATVGDDTAELSPVPETLGAELVPCPDTDSYETHSIVVGTFDPSDGETEMDSTEAVSDSTTDADGPTTTSRPTADGGRQRREAQGFQGTWSYQFKNASEATRTSVLALARFAEFAGVGQYNSRGAGTVSMSVLGGTWR